MMFTFSAYGCELFEGIEYRGENDNPAGNSDELMVGWAFSMFQRFVVNEPMLVLAAKGLPMLFASAFCANCCGESIVALLTVMVNGIVSCIGQMSR